MPTPRSLRGAYGERVARQHMEGLGYAILQTNYRCRWGEVDIVAQQDGTLVFVEVRTKQNLTYGTPQESISQRKMDRVVATAQTYLQQHVPESGHDTQLAPPHWRIDVIAVLLAPNGAVAEVQHIPNAIEE